MADSVRGPLKRACADAGLPQAPGIEARHKHRGDPDREPVEAGDVPAAAPVHGPAVLESPQVAALMPRLPPAPTGPTPASRVVGRAPAMPVMGPEPRAEFRLATRGPAPWVAPSMGAPAAAFVLTGAGLHEARTSLLQEFNPAIVAAQEEGTGAHLVGLILAVAPGAHDETVLDAAASAAALLAVAGSPLLQEAGGLEMCTLAVSRGALQGCTPAAVAALLQDLLRVTAVAAPAMAFRPLWAELQVLQPAACRPILGQLAHLLEARGNGPAPHSGGVPVVVRVPPGGAHRVQVPLVQDPSQAVWVDVPAALRDQPGAFFHALVPPSL